MTPAKFSKTHTLLLSFKPTVFVRGNNGGYYRFKGRGYDCRISLVQHKETGRLKCSLQWSEFNGSTVKNFDIPLNRKFLLSLQEIHMGRPNYGRNKSNIKKINLPELWVHPQYRELVGVE